VRVPGIEMRATKMRRAEVRATAEAMAAPSAAPAVTAASAAATMTAATTAAPARERHICRANRDPERAETGGKSQDDKMFAD
jgi:hypothetical protein